MPYYLSDWGNNAILGPPIWLWHRLDVASGEYAVPATTHNQHNDHYNSDHALLGLVPLARQLNRVAPRAIDL